MISKIYKNLILRNYDRGDLIYKQGEIPANLIFLINGLLIGEVQSKLKKNNQKAILFTPNKWCGEEYLFEKFPLTLNLVAEVECETVQIPFSVVRELISLEPSLQSYFLYSIATQSARRNYITLRRLYSNSIGKIFYTLLFLIEVCVNKPRSTAKSIDYHSDTLALNISQDCLARISAAGRTNTSNLLKYLEELGLLRTGYNLIEFFNLSAWLNCAFREANSRYWENNLNYEEVAQKLSYKPCEYESSKISINSRVLEY
ncbi:Crp/Fnr family transcriptional regulator [Undibacterium crateris]|uniref:Crp/Fnr family transcriptional regulator n=1 Tax=Undibacterium crateris TaxID=2528175 RepID=UPI001389B6FB|nr:Crp/Fnr family transcriptional regulator [Undibacterium crateris]NDI87660.1 cyclic nucleotide-binding domain-containing protein [Undibacterium crateris]